ncbi:hypothetical protein [Nocardia sp. NPDC051570]|uniref:hypothetical protein n=1 Tax=Nocardia sp. NPDC051570 TaxID=3364324 RepID=UPI00379D366B
MVSNPFRDAAAHRTGGGFTEDLHASLLAAEAHYFPGAHPQVIVTANGPLPPDTASALAMSLAAAATMFSDGRDMFNAGPPTAQDNHAALTEIVSPLAATSRTLIFAVAAIAPDPGAAVVDSCADSAECAVYQLCRTLPASADDDLTHAAIASLPPSQRAAVALFTTAVAELDRCVSVEFDGAVGTDHAVLSRAHARILRINPDIDRPREIVTTTGVLDADRTRRRTFYLNRPEGDLHGSVDADVLPRLPELIVRRITVQLEHLLSRPDAYRLVGVISADTAPASPH